MIYFSSAYDTRYFRGPFPLFRKYCPILTTSNEINSICFFDTHAENCTVAKSSNPGQSADSALRSGGSGVSVSDS